MTSKQLPGGSVIVKPGRGGIGGASAIILLVILLAGLLSLAGIGLFTPTKLAAAQEQTLGLIHGGIAGVAEQTFVDGCVSIEGLEGPRAITRTQRTVSFKDGTTLQVVFSGRPEQTNACP